MVPPARRSQSPHPGRNETHDVPLRKRGRLNPFATPTNRRRPRHPPGGQSGRSGHRPRPRPRDGPGPDAGPGWCWGSVASSSRSSPERLSASTHRAVEATTPPRPRRRRPRRRRPRRRRPRRQAPQRDPTRAAPYAGTSRRSPLGRGPSSPPRASRSRSSSRPPPNWHSHGTGHRIPVQGGQRGGRERHPVGSDDQRDACGRAAPTGCEADDRVRLSTWSLSSPLTRSPFIPAQGAEVGHHPGERGSEGRDVLVARRPAHADAERVARVDPHGLEHR